MTAGTGIRPGTELTSRRAVTAEDVAAVARITGDEGMHHVSGLAGRQVAQGLLTVAFAPLLRTEAGFRLESAQVTFLAPVFVGDTVACTVTVGRVDGPTVGFTLRISNQDDVEVATGEGTGTLTAGGAAAGAGHRLLSPDVSEDPNPTYRVDVGRQDTGHVAFGAGVHYRVGAARARVEGVASLQALLRRVPGIELDPAAPAAYRADSLQFRGLRTLPVVFPAAS